MSLFLPLLAGVAGIATHLLFFKRGEHHLYPIRYLQALAFCHLGSRPDALWRSSVKRVREPIKLYLWVFLCWCLRKPDPSSILFQYLLVSLAMLDISV